MQIEWVGILQVLVALSLNHSDHDEIANTIMQQNLLHLSKGLPKPPYSFSSFSLILAL